MMQRCMVYLSTGTHLMAEDELLELLEKARSNNKMLNITGMLLYSDGNFIQAIEGEWTAVGDLYQKIARDKRHYGIHKLVDEEISERSFDRWSMGFKSMGREQLAQLPGFSAFMNPGNSYEEAIRDGDALDLLRMFRDNN